MGGSNLDGLHHRVHPVSDPPAPKISRHWQYFVANLGLCCPSCQVGAYSRGKAPQDGCHLPTLSPGWPSRSPARPGIRRERRSATSAALRARAVPETVRGRRVDQSELRLPRRTGKSQPAVRSDNSAHGRKVSCALAGAAGRSHCLSGGRAGRHSAPGGQRAHRCRFHPRPGHRGHEPARHHVLGAGAYLRGYRQLQQSASRTPLLFRGNRARPFGGNESLPPGARRHRCRP